MFAKSKTLIITLFLAGAMLLAACNLPAASTPEPENPDLIRTAAVQTVIANMTQTAPQQPVATTAPVINEPVVATATSVVVLPTNPPASQPTNTQQPPLPTATSAPPLPTATQAPPTPTPIPCDRASFVASGETYKDGTEVAAGTTFVKTWRLKNTGSCTWNSGYSLVFISGDSMGAPAAVQLTSGTVAPGQEIDVSVTMKAPDAVKEYTGNWKLRNASGLIFGIGANADSHFWVKIKVVSPVTPTPTTPPAVVQYNFMDKAQDAAWRNSIKDLPWGDPGPDDAGVADFSTNAKLQDGKTYTKVLATFPEQVTNGYISGLFSNYSVQNKDRFRAQAGFRSGCQANASVKFQLIFVEAGNAPILIQEWTKKCDDKLVSMDVDLSSLAGRSVQFMLAVTTDGAPEAEKTVWVNPRIER
jgi:peroxiredoxin family protein